jgi:hypothetical protein
MVEKSAIAMIAPKSCLTRMAESPQIQLTGENIARVPLSGYPRSTGLR